MGEIKPGWKVNPDTKPVVFHGKAAEIMLQACIRQGFPVWSTSMYRTGRMAMVDTDMETKERVHWLSCPKVYGLPGDCICDKIDAKIAARSQEKTKADNKR